MDGIFCTFIKKKSFNKGAWKGIVYYIGSIDFIKLASVKVKCSLFVINELSE
jgi:hypothetical protein